MSRLLTTLRSRGGGGGGDGFVGSATSAGTSVDIPAHESGDLIIIFASIMDNTIIGAPASGWTDIQTLSALTTGYRLAYRIATGSDTVSGVWASAQRVHAYVYRGFTGVGAFASSDYAAASTTIGWPALTLDVTDESSWVLCLANIRNTDGDISIPPSGLTNIDSGANAAAGQSGAHHTGAGVASFASRSVNIGGTAGRFKALSLELIAA